MTCPAMLNKVLMMSRDHTSEERDTWEWSVMILTSAHPELQRIPLAWTSMASGRCFSLFPRFSFIVIVLVSFILYYINMSQVKTMNQCIRVGMKLTNLLMISVDCRIQEHWSQGSWESDYDFQRLGRVKWQKGRNEIFISGCYSQLLDSCKKFCCTVCPTEEWL